MFASCLKDDEEETVYSDDAAIISFTLSDLKRSLTTTAKNGSDSVYQVKVTGSSYKMYIDQIRHLIYNVDSLPYGTDVSKVLCTVSSKNSGLIVIQNINSDTLKYYNSSDSIDFTQPRKFIAYSVDGSSHQEYEVRLNVHYERNDQFVWNSADISLPDGIQGMKALPCNGRVYVFASDGSQTNVYYCEEDSHDGWKQAEPAFSTSLPDYSYQNVVECNQHFYTYANGRILKSDDGSTWVETSKATLLRLVAASNNSLYALSHAGMLVSSADEGATWNVEALDESPSLLPIQDISYCCLPSRVNDATEYIVLAGNRTLTNYFNDRYAMVWSKVAEYSEGSRNDSWMYISACDVDSVALPRLSNLTLASYNGNMIALGGSGIGACDRAAFSQLYYSQDGGVYWRNDKNYKLPKDFEGQDAFALTVDSKGRIWIITGKKVWKGYYPDAVWEKSQKSFTE